MAVNFPSNPTNGQTITANGITYAYDSTQGVWSDSPQGLTQAIDALTDVDTSTVAPTNGQVLQWNSTDSEWQPADSSAGVTVYATIDDLPLSGVAEGSMALVDSTDKLYIFSDTGWYSISIVNTSPTISGVSATYTLATDGTATTVTVTATDPEGIPLTYSIVSDTSGNIATVSQGTGSNTNVWTITPSTNTANAGSFTLVFRASDGTNVASASSTFELKFTVVNSNYTTALITPTDNGYTTNKVFRDSSGNNHTITANGDATQNTFSPYRHGGYSTYFDGTGDYLALPNHSSFNFTGEFCIEFWYYGKVVQNGVVFQTDGSNAGGWGVGIWSSNFKVYRGGFTVTNTTTISAGQWYHVRLNRDSNNDLRIFVNGVSGSTYTDSTTNASYSNPRIGNNGSYAPESVNGYISDLRVVNGSSIGTSNFTAPTERLTAITNTSLLTCHLPYIADGSTNDHSITVNGNTKTEPFGPYDYGEYSASDHGGSAYFDGTGDYLKVADDAGFDMGTGDFTIELWMHAGSQGSSYAGLVSSSDYNAAGSSSLRFDVTGTNDKLFLYCRSASPSADPLLTSSSALSLNAWHHVALVRDGTSLKFYVDGSENGSVTIPSGQTFDFSNGEFRVGRGFDVDGANAYFTGYITDLRIVKGTAVYTSDFTPPTAPLTAITNTSLLLPFDDATIIDKSQTSKAVKLAGNTTISATQTKYLSYSMYFDGTGDYIEIADTLGEFTNYSNATLEMWVYPTTSSGSQNLIEKFTPASGPGWTLYTTTGTLNLQWYGGGTTNASTAMTVNQWNHVAVVHHNGTRKIYVNGTGGTGVTVSSSVSTNPLRVGVRGTTGNFFTGYMSDIRIQLGRAVYTADFTPPTAALEG